MDIPDELIESIRMEGYPACAEDELRVVVSDFARAAQVAVLRELADELEVLKNEMREEDNRTIRSSGLGEGIQRLRAKANELEAGAGQTGGTGG